MPGRQRYSKEFKREAVRLVLQEKVAMTQVARDLDLHVNALRNSVRAVREDPEHAFPGEGRQKPDEAELTRRRREVVKLRAERDILKQAAAYFAKESM
jgi:transposase